MIRYKGYISILLTFVMLTMNGIATTNNENNDIQLTDNDIQLIDNDIQSILTNIDIHMSTNVDIQKIKDIVKKVDYDKFIDIKPEDLPLTTEDNLNGIARVDYVYYGKFKEEKQAVKRRTNSVSSISSRCFKTFGKWSGTPIYYIINPSNSQGISQDLITSTILASSKTWDDVVSRNLFDSSTDSNAQVGVYDQRNVIGFGPYNDPGVIAVTSVWYNMYTRQIYEFDIRFNTGFVWGDATTNSDPYLMDIQDIATHEIGHGTGLGDLYQSYCSQATMYGYSSYREMQKRTLESGDINGIRKLYGS